jgi:hypothetical protein
VDATCPQGPVVRLEKCAFRRLHLGHPCLCGPATAFRGLWIWHSRSLHVSHKLSSGQLPRPNREIPAQCPDSAIQEQSGIDEDTTFSRDHSSAIFRTNSRAGPSMMKPAGFQLISTQSRFMRSSRHYFARTLVGLPAPRLNRRLENSRRGHPRRGTSGTFPGRGVRQRKLPTAVVIAGAQ